jgi:hypothetical protein
VSIKVEFGFGKQGEGGAPQFNDISNDVIDININRGKDPDQDTFNAASCSITLNNQTRNYDPDYGPSPYQGQIVPTGQVRIYKDDQRIFTGFITDWNFTYNPTGESLAEIIASDAFWNLNNQRLTDYEPVEQLSSARILSVLTRPEVGGTVVWPASSRLISPGVATMGDYPVSDGTNVLSYLQEVEKAEPGRLFIDKSGRIVFRSRNNDLSNPDFNYIRLNLSSNPSFENDTTSWVATTGTITRSTAQAYIGTASGSVASNAVVNQFFSSNFGATYTASIYARASSGTVALGFTGVTSTDGTTYSEINETLGTVTDSGWTRLQSTFDAVSVYSGLRVKATGTAVFIDNALIEETPIVDAYFDGDNPPVYNTTDPDAPDYQPERAFESYNTAWVLGT